MEYIMHYESPLGGITMASNGRELTGLWFDGQKYFGRTLDPDHAEKSLPIFDMTAEWLSIYFSGNKPSFTPPLLPQTTAFQKTVLDILLTIPYGRTKTYKEIANLIAKERALPSMSAQAVGSAVGHNPISIIIPCHRVVGSDGNLTGYAGGLDKKIRLLTLELESTK